MRTHGRDLHPAGGAAWNGQNAKKQNKKQINKRPRRCPSEAFPSTGAAPCSPGFPVPSALRGLTSLFGMVRGGSPAPGALLSRFPSTIGAAGLNFPVRNGKGWIPRATAALPYDCHRHRRKQHVLHRTSSSIFPSRKAFGVLVPLGFAIADFAPAAYQRRRLRRP